jgi:Transposase
MTRTRHTEEQIIAVLKDAQAGASVQDLCRKHGISDATLYKWKFSMSHVQDYRRTSRRMLKKARLLTRPTLAVISPARPASAKTDSLPWDVPCPKQCPSKLSLNKRWLE